MELRKIAMMEDNIVKNIAVVGDDPWDPGKQYQLMDVTDIYCGPGFVYDPDLKSFSPPVNVEPQERSVSEEILDLKKQIEDLKSSIDEISKPSMSEGQ